MRWLLPALLVCCFILPAYPQKEKTRHFTDSLESRLSDFGDDTLKAKVLVNLALNFQQINIDTALMYCRQAQVLSSKLNYTLGLKQASNNLGIIYYQMGKYEDAIKAFEFYKYLCSTTGDSTNIAWGYNNIGNIYIELGRYNTTLNYYDSALHIWQLLKDTTAFANSYVNIGYVYKDLGKYTEALYYLFKSLRTYEAANRKKGMAYSLNFIGTVYTRKKEYEKSNFYTRKAAALYRSLENYDGVGQCVLNMAINYRNLNEPEKSKQSLLEAIGFFTDVNDQRQIAIIYSMLGAIHKEKKELKEALSAYTKALEINTGMGNMRVLPDNLTNIAEIQLLLGSSVAAEKYARKAMEYAEQNGSIEYRRNAAHVLSRCLEAIGNTSEAFRYYKLYSVLKDTMENTEALKNAQEIQTKYETEKKDLELTAKNLELENASFEINKKRIQLIALFVSVVLICIIFILAYNRYKLKQRSLLDAELLKEQGLRNKAIIEAEERERIRIAKDLHDGVGQQISAVKMNLSALDHEIQLTDTQKTKMDVLLSLVDDAVKEVRSVSHQMMPNALIRSGLSIAVREFVQKLSAVDTIKIDLQIVGLNNRLENTTETVLYRVLQECVSNIIKHAHATHISIQLIKHDNHLNMMVEDNGTGFDTSSLYDNSGIGIKNIISRVQFLNGTIHFDSLPGKGTTIIVDIPL